jgi:crossover junction endodeoxyribonuclease RuvC
MEPQAIRIFGIDPGLRHMGWGVVELAGTRLSYIASGVISPPAKDELPVRLASLYGALEALLRGINRMRRPWKRPSSTRTQPRR